MNDERESASFEDALRSGLKAPVLSPDALERIRRATEAEWRASVPLSWWRRPAVLATAASVLVVGLASGLFLAMPAADGAAMATLAHADAPGLREARPWRTSRVVTAGTELRAGQHFESLAGAVLSLKDGGQLRVAADSDFEVLAQDRVRLARGEMYADFAPGARAAGSFTVITPAGEFRHVGTQFALAVAETGTRLRVREGSVSWSSGGGESTVVAGMEIHIDRDQRVTRRNIDTVGDGWAWVEALAPDFDIESRPLSEFLTWVARETGRKLVFADDETRRQVDGTLMHGNVRGMSSLDALRAVMAATSLRFDLPEGAIRVSLASAATPIRQ